MYKDHKIIGKLKLLMRRIFYMVIMCLENLTKIFKSKGFFSAGEFYLPIKDCINFIEKLTDNNIAILGVDFFHITNNKIIPVDPINSIDFSGIEQSTSNWVSVIQKTNRHVQKIIENEIQKDSSQWCNFILLEQAETIK